MKKLYLFIISLCLVSFIQSQEVYWVIFTDKNNTEFNPYEYFDKKAIERRVQSGISLYCKTDYPLNTEYKSIVSDLSDEVIGESRWINAVAVSTCNYRIKEIKQLHFVESVVLIQSKGVISSYSIDSESDFEVPDIRPQLKRMEGEAFVNNNVDGSGIRIAVLDGGFKGVDTHPAFQHLFENNRIIATYNFPKKREDVYGWHSHGTMVLSCIAGIAEDGRKIGLATGAEFLLARTEINLEPEKEEVWWMMAMEWADKHGANIINSSLGYGSDRHNVEDMDGSSTLVTRAANIAASKGILVVNSMGNEATSSSWKTLIAPADADSVIAVGGIDQNYGRHISFSSFGPTADGRLKPNVVAYGNAFVAKPEGYGRASGTSFSSPLVAGFAACAWQINPNLSNMELKREIEKSGDNYPYFDYAIGYGVPQADYFFNQNKTMAAKSFDIFSEENMIVIKPLKSNKYEKVNLFYHIRNSNGIIEIYEHLEFWLGSSDEIKINMASLLPDKTLMVHANGYTEEYKLSEEEIKNLGEIESSISYASISGQRRHLAKIPENDKPSNFGPNAKYYIQPYINLSFVTPPTPQDYNLNHLKSGGFSFGLRSFYSLSKWYKTGINLEIQGFSYHIDHLFGEYDADEYRRYNEFIKTSVYTAEFFQRFRLIPGAATKLGVFMDLGVYGSWISSASLNQNYVTTYGFRRDVMIDSGDQYYVWGFRARFGYSLLSVFAQYKMTDLILYNDYLLPKFEAGLEFSIPTSF